MELPHQYLRVASLVGVASALKTTRSIESPVHVLQLVCAVPYVLCGHSREHDCANSRNRTSGPALNKFEEHTAVHFRPFRAGSGAKNHRVAART